MFNTLENTCPFPTPSHNNNQHSSEISDRSLQMKMAQSRECRSQKMSRMREMHSMSFINYEGVSFSKFAPNVQKQTNTYTLLATVFTIADDFTWRQYLGHLEILIKKITNLIEASKGKVLQQINSKEQLGGYNFQERLESMLHLSNKEFQQHLLIFIHAIVAYNKRYCFIDQAKLSDHLARRHSYEKFIREDVIWLLTRMSLSCQAVNKVGKNYLQNSQNSPLLPVLTIFANFIYEQPEHIVLQFIQTAHFQQILQLGLYSPNFQTQRECAFICNNLLFKSTNCQSFISQRQSLIAQVSSLQNNESDIFKTVIANKLQLQKTQKMQEQNML